jgi:hypothetical protein
MNEGVAKGYWSMQDAQAKIAEIPTDSAGYQNWRLGQLQRILPMADLLKANSPTISTRNTGGTTDTIASDPLTGATRVVNTVRNTVSPDTVATQAGENSRANLSRGTQLMVAGLNPDGSLSGNTSALVDQLGKYDINPSLALQRLPLGQRSALIAQVQAKYPGWDETQYDAKKGGAQKFAYGDQGNQMRSFATSGAHLDQLGTLIDNLDNHDNQTLNKIGNAISQWNGNTPVTNFDAAKSVISKEVMKSIVAGGGGEAERKELSDSLANAKSPQQLKGVVQQYRSLMSAQYENLLAQRRALGLPDSTLPNYNASAPPPPAANGWKIEVVK